MIVAEIDGLGWGHCISTTHQVVLLDDPPIRLPHDGCPGRGGNRPHDAAAAHALDAKGLAQDASLPSGCSFSNTSACFRSVSGRSCGQDKDRIVRR